MSFFKQILSKIINTAFNKEILTIMSDDSMYDLLPKEISCCDSATD